MEEQRNLLLDYRWTLTKLRATDLSVLLADYESRFNIDIETYQACGGAVRIISCIEDPIVIENILTHLDKKDPSEESSLIPPCRAPPQGGLFD